MTQDTPKPKTSSLYRFFTNRWTVRCIIVATVAVIFLAPVSPLGSAPASAGTPEVPPAMLPFVIAGVSGMLVKIRGAFKL